MKSAHPDRWQLDCSARFYPVVNTARTQSLFCIGAVLDDDVDVERLTRAACAVAPHYPTICATLKRGFLWHRLQRNDAPIRVYPLGDRLLEPIDQRANDGHFFRLSAGGREVRLEIFHALTDGTGALEFLKATLARYADENCEIVDRSGEKYIEDSFERYYDPTAKFGLKEMAGATPHRHAGTPIKGEFKADGATLSAAELVAAAKARGASVTAYLTGMLACAIERTSKPRKPVVMMVPVNLRTMFPSETVRNFTLFVRVVIKPNELDSPDLYIAEAKRQLALHADKAKLSAQISTAVRGVRLISWVPLVVKTALVRFGRLVMRSRQTIIFSNLGRVTLPEGVHAQQLYLKMNVSKNNVQNLGAITLGDNCALNFTRCIEEDSLTKTFFSLLHDDLAANANVAQQEDKNNKNNI